MALALAAVGVYGVTSTIVSQRTHEIGVRMALGADRRTVLALVSGRSVLLAAAALGIGLGAALLLTRVLSSLLYGVSPTDPATLGGLSLLLAFVVLLASYVPARRATRIDPLEALRHD